MFKKIVQKYKVIILLLIISLLTYFNISRIDIHIFLFKTKLYINSCLASIESHSEYKTYIYGAIFSILLLLVMILFDEDDEKK